MALYNLFPNGKDDLFKAFILYSMVGAIAASLAVHIRLSIDNNIYGISDYVKNSFNWVKKRDEGKLNNARLIIAIFITFLVTIVIYHVMWFLVGFGGGLLAPPGKKIKYFS